MDNESLIKKVALILGVTENMVKHHLSFEQIIDMMVEQYERLEEYKWVNTTGGNLNA